MKSKNSKWASHLQTNEEKQSLADNQGAVIAVKKLDEYMEEHKLGILQVFRDFDDDRNGLLSNSEILAGLMKLDVEMTQGQAKSLVTFLDQGGDGEIDLMELDNCIKDYRKHKKDGTLEELISDKVNEPLDAVFPNWLVNRRDFRLVFTRFQEKDELDEHEQVLKSFLTVREKRTHEDLQRIVTWMDKRDILPGLGSKRFGELAKQVYFKEYDKGHILCRQGDIGDAFYIIFEGAVRVVIDGGVVGELLPGQGFGDRSLETDEPRSATCVTSERTQCVVIKSNEYKIMMKNLQQKKLTQNMGFLQHDCKIMRSWTYPKVFKLSKALVRRRFDAGDAICKQGEEAHVMYLLYKGTVSIQKEVVYKKDNRWPEPKSEYTVITHERTVALHMTDLGTGDHFGEEVALGYSERQYSAVAKESTECFAINKIDIMKFFMTNQVIGELRENNGAFYEAPEEVKSRHDWKVRQDILYEEIKSMAFGEKYKSRAGLHMKTKITKRAKPGSLEEKLKKLNDANREKQVAGLEVDGDEDVHDARSVFSGSTAPSITNSVNNPRRLPILRQRVTVRRESQSERNMSIRNSLSLPSLHGDAGFDAMINKYKKLRKKGGKNGQRSRNNSVLSTNSHRSKRGSELEGSIGSLSMSQSIKDLER
eukprot:CAMPEP_0118647982 /NCGR_PEP_ID=MMETSP0785-20121206/8904_1 /TAXON_ID=91992 /ORGANISM="Bolidomonas pacifica, Strain CCMP 1866" /LENGTH=648 /DNA_ID=CAMNT_0006540127 /DNA_START=181 /DNA_END=2124 /DNA_ORIENTATION=+